MARDILTDDLTHLPSQPSHQEFLLRLLCHVAQLDGRVHQQEALFIELLAEKMGRVDWEFPEGDARLSVGEVSQVYGLCPHADERLWLVGLLRSLAAVDGFVCKDETAFLNELAARLFSSSDRDRHEIDRTALTVDERSLVDAALRAASLSDTTLWHRKTGKVVGAAVGIEQDGTQQIFSGVNFELSQPTGSRCAEQVALGSALVQLGERLRYQDVRRVAVVAGANVPKPIPNPLPPCGVCCEMLHKLNEAKGQIQLYMLAARGSTRVVRIALSEYYPPRLPR